jgi:hypothetical protein
LITLSIANPYDPNDVIVIRSLRPLEWIRAIRATPGESVPLALNEIGAYGIAQVHAIEPCPPIEDGPGRVVLSTVTHLNPTVMRIWLEGSEIPIEPTASHRLYSEDRGEWNPAAELRVGESIRTRTGSARIIRIEQKSGAHRVYNLEVETEHWYYVGEAGVLSHNVLACYRGFVAGMTAKEAKAWVAYWTKRKGPEFGAPFQVIKVFTPNGNLKRVITYGRHGRKHKTYDIINRQGSPHEHPWSYRPGCEKGFRDPTKYPIGTLP